MNQDVAIKVESISKKYTIGEKENFPTLRDHLMNLPKKLFSRKKPKEFWALKDISFEVKKGEILGIIGKNGAGKSTLLKILSRITEPTSGQITMVGKVASLLEVGTGFNPELTGRENIYLNGAIIGMSRNEIRQKFNDIIAFADIGNFLDTPVKRYSSGMYVRLAFAVSAHLDADILLVDEVLAVGDAEFQKKCINKMNSLARSGKTVIFISHSVPAVIKLCSRCVWIEKGKIAENGDVQEVIDKYVDSTSPKPEHKEISNIISSCKRFKLNKLYWVDEEGNKVSQYKFGENPILRLTMTFMSKVRNLCVGCVLVNNNGDRLFTSHHIDDAQTNIPKDFQGKMVFQFKTDLPNIAPGEYKIIVGVRDQGGETLLYSEGDIYLKINNPLIKKSGANGIVWHTGSWGVVK